MIFVLIVINKINSDIYIKFFFFNIYLKFDIYNDVLKLLLKLIVIELD